jgi:hypothetical protein
MNDHDVPGTPDAKLCKLSKAPNSYRLGEQACHRYARKWAPLKEAA